MNKKRFVIFLMLTATLIGIGWMFIRKDHHKTETGIKYSWQKYYDLKGRYEMDMPSGWIISESTSGGKFISRIVWQMTQNSVEMGNIAQISVTVVSSPSANQPLSTLKEFNEWYKTSNGMQASDSGTIKVSNIIISGNRAVILKEEEVIKEDPQNSFFSYTCWLRPEYNNYYINIMGDGLYTDKENRFFDMMLGSFKLHP